MSCDDQPKTIEIERGEDDSILVKAKYKNGQPVDFTGYSFFFTAKNSLEDADEDAVIASDLAPEDLVDPETGVAAIPLPHSKTDKPAGSYPCDVWWRDATGRLKKIFKGELVINDSATERAGVLQ